MEKEEQFILKSPDRRRILMDFYETNMNQEVLLKLLQHIEHLRPRIIKLVFSANKSTLKKIRKAIYRQETIRNVCCYFATDMEESKTWLVSEGEG